MRAGALRQRITIQQAIESQDSSGSVTKVWTTFATIWAAYEPQTGSESFKEDQEQAVMGVRFRTRFKAGITPKMRVSFDGRVFDILSLVDVNGRSKQLHIMTRENV